MTINKRELMQFSGSETLTRYNTIRPNVLLTDGAQYIAKEGSAYWLIDVIASGQILEKVKAEPFQVWQLFVNPDLSAMAVCDDGNDNVLYRQEIQHTDFELHYIKLYAINEGGNLIIMLPSEY